MFSLEIKTDNAAFTEGWSLGEVARILRDLADKIEHDGHEGARPVYDINGNCCGQSYCDPTE